MNIDVWTDYADDGQDIDIMVNNVIDHLQQSEIKLDLFMSGGGTNLVPWLMGKVGCSKYINQVRIPYSTQEFKRCLQPEYIKKYCTANAAFRLASETPSTTHNTFRIGIVASLQNQENPDQQRIGRENHAYVCFIYENKLLLKHVRFLDALSREEQEYQLAYYVISLLEQCFKRFNIWDMITPEDTNILSFVNIYLKHLTKPICIYSGSFRPMHDGHRYIKNYNGNPALLEIPFESFGKDPQALVDNSIAGNTYFRLSKTRIIDKLEFLEILMDMPMLEIGDYPCNDYRMGSDTLNRIGDDEFEFLNKFKHWKFQIFDREHTTKDLCDTVESKLVNLERYEYISMPKELIGISSTKIREKQNKQNV